MKKFLVLLFYILISSAVIISQSSASDDNSVNSDDIREKEQKITENISEQVEKQIPRVRGPEVEKRLSDLTAMIKPHMTRDLN